MFTAKFILLTPESRLVFPRVIENTRITELGTELESQRIQELQS